MEPTLISDRQTSVGVPRYVKGGICMTRVIAILLIAMVLVGCASPRLSSTEPSNPERPESNQVPTATIPVEPSFESRVSQPTIPLTKEQEATATKNLTSPLVPYRNDRYGVSLSYPEHLGEPGIPQTGFPALTLDLGNGEITVYREQATPGKSLADLAKENIEANTKASAGRTVSKDLGKQTLGGEEAWEVQRHWDSSVARYDAIQYFVLKGGFEYRVACGTKQAPPAIPWGAVEPMCQRILSTIKFEP